MAHVDGQQVLVGNSKLLVSKEVDHDRAKVSDLDSTWGNKGKQSICLLLFMRWS